MMFCKNCGSSMSDDAAFCPRCGTSASSAQPSKDVPPASDMSPQSKPEADTPSAGRVCANCGTPMEDGDTFCGKCGTSIASTQQPSNTTGTAAVPDTIDGATRQARRINKGKIILDLCLSLGVNFVIGFLVIHLFCVMFVTATNAELSIRDLLDPQLISLSVGSGIFCGVLLTILDAIVIHRRLKDPEDTAYEIGSTQAKVVNKMFKMRHGKIKSIMKWIVYVISFTLFFIVPMWKEFEKHEGEESQTTISSNASSDKSTVESGSVDESSASSSSSTSQLNISDTTYFVLEDSELTGEISTIILEPDGSCIYLAEFPTVSADYYGSYQQTEKGIDLHLNFDDNYTYDIPLAYDNGSLAYIGTGFQIQFAPGMVYRQSEEPHRSPLSVPKAVAATTYYVFEQTDFPIEDMPTLILESDNTCALLANIDNKPTYLYGTYEFTSNGGKLRLTNTDDSIFYISMVSTANGFDCLTENSWLGLGELGGRCYEENEIPKSVQVHPPYSNTTETISPTTVSETTYYYMSDGYSIEYAPVVTLKPDNTCDFLENAGGRMVNLEGQYEMNSGGVILYLTCENGSIATVPLEYTEYGLVCVSDAATGIGIYQDSEFVLSDELPLSLAMENLFWFLYQLPREFRPPQPLEGPSIWLIYEGTVNIDGQTHYLFSEDYYDFGTGDMMAVNAQTGELLGIYIEDDTAYTMPLEEWLNGYLVLKTNPWADWGIF